MHKLTQPELNDLFQALTTEFGANEMRYGHLVIDHIHREIYFPAVWIDCMRTSRWIDSMGIDPDFVQELNKCVPIGPEYMAPMSPLLRDLATKLELPHYEGKLTKFEVPNYSPQAASTDSVNRCEFCGGKLVKADVHAWKSLRNKLGWSAQPCPVGSSRMRICKDCGKSYL